MTGGEYLSDALRQRLEDTFHCYVQTSYSCTEGGTVACECREKHFHINDDWLIVEPVDRLGNPVPAGQQADKYLLTNLYNYTQPVIRYEVTDRIIYHQEACPCGNPSPWIEIEGRNDDVLTFKANGAELRVPPLAIYAELKEVRELRRFQLLKYPGNRQELRLEPMPGVSRELLFTLTETGGLAEMIGVLLADTIMALTDGILLAVALRYFTAEQEAGTPFAKRGAEQIQRLGIRTIVFPLVAVILIAIVYTIFDLPRNPGSDWSNLTSVTMGIVLILASLIFRYGAELEGKQPCAAQEREGSSKEENDREK